MELPLFPLHVVLFPGRPLPLHLFEPRYRRMLQDCLADERRFGVVAIRAGREVGSQQELFDVGTIAEIERVAELPDGRYEILTRGRRRFRILERLTPDPYQRAEVELLSDGDASAEQAMVARRVRQLLLPYLAELGAPEELLGRVPTDADGVAYLAAAAAQVEVPQQQLLLELPTTDARLAAIFQMLRRETGLMRHLGRVGSLRPPGPGGAELN